MKKILPPTYFLATLVAMTVLHFTWPGDRYLEFPLNLVGLVLLVSGVVLNVIADREFKRHQTTVHPFRRSAALVTAFPYTITRNPMYLGLLLMLLGVATLFATASTLLPVLPFAVLMDRRFILVEERKLAKTFGSAWEQYRMRVRRWL